MDLYSFYFILNNKKNLFQGSSLPQPFRGITLTVWAHTLFVYLLIYLCSQNSGLILKGFPSNNIASCFQENSYIQNVITFVFRHNCLLMNKQTLIHLPVCYCLFIDLSFL